MKNIKLLLTFLSCLAFYANAAFPQLSSNNINTDRLLTNFKYLSSDELAGRKPQTSGHLLAQKYITQEYKTNNLLSFNVNYQHTFNYESSRQNKHGVNLLGYVTGIKYPNLYWVVTAHYDHLGDNGRSVFNGADDNASGVAAMLALSRYFSEHPPQYSIIFLATDAEEDGLKGAKEFISNPPVPLDAIVLNINLDMLSQDAKWKTLYVAGTRGNKNLKTVISHTNELLQTNSFKLKRGHDRVGGGRLSNKLKPIDWKKASDHSEFRKKNIAYLYFGVDTHKDYHTVNDTFENANISFYLQGVNAILVSLQQLEQLLPQQIQSNN